MEDYIPTHEDWQMANDVMEVGKALSSVSEKKELFKQVIKDQVLNGYLNPLEFYRQAKIITECIDELKKDSDIYECAYTEREKYGKEKPKINGSVIDHGSRQTFDYKSCNDSEWNRLKEELSKREAFLKNVPPEGTVDPKTGELIMPPSIKVSNFFTVK